MTLQLNLRGCRHHLWDNFKVLEERNAAQEQLFLQRFYYLHAVCHGLPGKVSVLPPCSEIYSRRFVVLKACTV